MKKFKSKLFSAVFAKLMLCEGIFSIFVFK